MFFWLLGIKHTSLHWWHVETRGSHQQWASISQGAGVSKGESCLAPSLQPGEVGFAKGCLVLCMEEMLGTEEAMLRCGGWTVASPRLRVLPSAHLLPWDLPAAPLAGLIPRLPHTELGGDLIQLLSASCSPALHLWVFLQRNNHVFAPNLLPRPESKDIQLADARAG